MLQWKRAIGFGALLWILMFVIISAFIGFGIYQGMWMELLGSLLGGGIAYILAGYMKPTSYGLALGYGLTWVVVGVILDAIVTVRFAPNIFTLWTMWVGYALVLLAPMLRVKRSA
jgi:hypothetical protein